MSTGPADVKLRQTIWTDLREMAVVKAVPFPSVGSLVDVAMLPGTWAVLIFRIAHELHRRGMRPLSRLLYFANVVLFGFDVAPATTAGAGLVCPHPVGIAISGGTVLGKRNRVLRTVSIGGSGDPSRPGSPSSGDDVWFMDNSKVFGDIHVGDRSIVGCLAVITADVPEDTFVQGIRRATPADMRPLADVGLSDHHLRDSAWKLRQAPRDSTGTEVR